MNWDDAKYFLAVARTGQMLGAAKKLGVSQSMLSRRVTSLETSLSCKLFDRTTAGCMLTESGAMFLDTAVKIETEFENAKSVVRNINSNVSGTVRIGAPDGFGVAFLASRAHLLKDHYPELTVQLVPVPHSFSLSQREVDIAIMVGRPNKGRLRVRKLTDYSLSIYAAKTYLDQTNPPEKLSDLANHRLVGYVEDLIYTSKLNYNSEVFQYWTSGIEISSALGLFEAVKSGAGIGVLHDFMVAKHDGLINLFPEISLKRSYWTVWHENMKSARRIAVVAKFLEDEVRKHGELFSRSSV